MENKISYYKEAVPEDFMFELTTTEKNELVTNCDRLAALKHSSVNPFQGQYNQSTLTTNKNDNEKRI